MMKTIYTLLFTLVLSFGVQAQKTSANEVMNSLLNKYNKEQYADIYFEFSPVMQKEMPQADTETFFRELYMKFGKMLDFSQKQVREDGVVFYEVDFQEMMLHVLLDLDDQAKISGLEITIPENTQLNSASLQEITEAVVANEIQGIPEPYKVQFFQAIADLPNKVQFSIALHKNGKTTYYGIIKSDHKVQVIKNSDKVFEIGSITKIFTSTILAQAVVEGKIKATDLVNKQFDFEFKDGITLRYQDLSNHSSGAVNMPENFVPSDMQRPYIDYDFKKLQEYLQTGLHLEPEASRGYHYSNFGAAMVGNGMSRLYGKSLADLFNKYIFTPNKMTHTYVQSTLVKSPMILGVDDQSNEVPNWDYDAFFGAGGVYSTAEDIMKFALTTFDPKNKAMQLTQQPTFRVNDKMQMGLGWHLLEMGDGNVLFHNGGTGGYTSSMMVNPSTQTAVVILSNLSAYSTKMKAIDKLCIWLIKNLNQKQ